VKHVVDPYRPLVVSCFRLDSDGISFVRVENLLLADSNDGVLSDQRMGGVERSRGKGEEDIIKISEILAKGGFGSWNSHQPHSRKLIDLPRSG